MTSNHLIAGSGEEIITSSYGWVMQLMLVIVCHDYLCSLILARRHTLDMNDVERKITDRTEALIVIHTYGRPAEMGELVEVAGSHDLPIIEDHSHAHGAQYKCSGYRCWAYRKDYGKRWSVETAYPTFKLMFVEFCMAKTMSNIEKEMMIKVFIYNMPLNL